MRCEEAHEWITALADGELSADERTAIESHVAGCQDCRQQLAREKALKNHLQRTGAAIRIPSSLRAKIEDQIKTPGSTGAFSWVRFTRGGFGAPRLGLAGAFGIAILAIVTLLIQWRPQADIGAAALATHEGIISGKESFTRSQDPVELRKGLALAVDNRFAPVALDLSMAKLHPVAGFVKKIGGRDVLVTIYEGDGPTITCFTFLGTEADAPKSAELLRDEEARVSFFIFSQGGKNAVMHQIGEVICILIANLDSNELLDLLRGKAHRA
jgi:anti-sigma factor (TIGR02949 family)